MSCDGCLPCWGRAGNCHSWCWPGWWERSDGAGTFQECLIQGRGCKKGCGPGREAFHGGQLRNSKQTILGLWLGLGTWLLLGVPMMPMHHPHLPCCLLTVIEGLVAALSSLAGSGQSGALLSDCPSPHTSTSSSHITSNLCVPSVFIRPGDYHLS